MFYIKKIKTKCVWFFILLFLFAFVFLSGCLDVLNIFEKEVCKNVTHFSSTDIPVCASQSSCYSQVSKEVKSHDSLPRELTNQINYYKNYLASTIFYFNESRKDVEKIYSFCSDFVDPAVIFNVNDYLYNIRNIFDYLDNTNTKSIELLTSYATFLQSQDIGLISEEDLFKDFVLVNENLNELHYDKTSKTNYVAGLKQSTKEANELAQKFGFKDNYLSRMTFTNLITYYLDISKDADPQKETPVPVYSNAFRFVAHRFANYENLKNVNLRLINTDTYNLYLFLDKAIGFRSSNFVEFSSLNNSIIDNLEKIRSKIKTLEEDISSNLAYLEQEKIYEFQRAKEDYKHSRTTFGHHLSFLKSLNIEIEENKEASKINTYDKAQKIKTCEQEISKINTNNYYLLDLISSFKKEENYVQKIELCETILNNWELDDCLSKMDLLKEEGYDIDLFEVCEGECRELSFNYNYILESNEKIRLLNTLLEEILEKIRDIKKFELSTSKELTLLEYEDKTLKEKKNTNIEKMISIDSKLKEFETINTKLFSLLREEVENDLISSLTIIYEDNYYFNYYNKTSFLLEDLCITNTYTNLSSLSDYLSTTPTKICFKTIFPGLNYYEIEYENKKTLTTKLLELSLTKTLFETLVENEVLGIYDSIVLEDIILVDNFKHSYDGRTLTFVTEPLNKILYHKNLFEYSTRREILETLKDIIIIKETWTLKNTSDIETSTNLKFFRKEGFETFTVLENDVYLTPIILDDWVYLDVFFKPGEERVIEVNKLLEKEFAFYTAEIILGDLKSLLASEFLEIKKASEKIAKDISLDNISEADLTNLEKILNQKEEVEKLKEREQELLETLTKFEALKNEFLESNYNDNEVINKLEQLEENKYSKPLETLLALETYISIINQRKEELLDNLFRENQKQVLEIKTKLSNHDLLTPTVVSELDGLDLKQDIASTLQNYEVRIDKSERELAFKNQDLILTFEKEFESYDLYELFEKVRVAYEGVQLSQLYDVNVMPPFTLADLERFEKKIKFKDTITFGREIDSFNDAVFSEEYELANKRLNQSTLNKIEEALLEKSIFVNGLETIVKQTRDDYETHKTKLSLARLEEVDLYLEQERYLLVLFLLRSSRVKESNKFSLITQITVFLIILLLLFLAYSYYNKRPEKVSKEEMKKKIIRKY